MPGAVIVANQPTGAGAGSPGVARNDLWATKQIDLSVGVGGNTSFFWELLDVPPGSASVVSSATSATPSFTPDLIGTYRLRLTTNSGGPGNVQTLVYRVRYDSLGVLSQRGWAYPAFGEEQGESNYGGNLRGWAQVFETVLEDIRTNFGGGSAPSTIYKPGVASVDNQYNTWAGAFAAALTPLGLSTLLVDDSVTSPALVNASSYNFESRGTLVGNVNKSILSIPAGGVIQNPRCLDHLTILGDDGSINFSPAVSAIDVFFSNVDIENTTGSTGTITLGGSLTAINIYARDTEFLLNAGEVLNIPVGVTVWLYLSSNSELNADTIRGAGNIAIYADESCIVSTSHVNHTGSLTYVAYGLPAGTADQVPKHNGVAWTAGKIVNANVDAAAAIAGSKVAPNFGAQALTAGSAAVSSLQVTGYTNVDPENSVVMTNGSGNTSHLSDVVLSSMLHIPFFTGVVIEPLGVWTRVSSIPWNGDNTLVPNAAPKYDLAAIGEVSNLATNCEIRLFNVTDAVQIGSTISVNSIGPAVGVLTGITMPAAAKILEVQVRTSNNLHTATISGAFLRVSHP